MRTHKLPAGGPFNLSPEVSATVIAHLEVFASPNENADYRRTVKRRRAHLAKLSDYDKGVLRTIGNALVRLGSAATK